MPSAADIYSQIRQPVPQEGPLDQYTKMLSVKNLMGNSDLQEMQRKQLGSQLTEDEAYRNAAQESGGDLNKLRDLLFQRGAPKSAMSVEAQRIKAEKEAADLAKTKVETHGAQIKQLRDMTATVQSDADLAALREQATRFYGPKVAETIPQSVNDPNFAPWQRKAVMTGDKLIEQTTPKYEKFDLGGKTVTVDMNPVTNPGVKNLKMSKTPTPGEIMNNRVALANLAIKGAESTPGGVFSIPSIVAAAQGGSGGGGAPAAPAAAAPAPGMVPASSLLRSPQNAFPQAPAPQAAPVQPAPAAAAPPAAMSSNPIQAAIASGKSGDELLKMLPPEISSQVKQMVEGRMAPPTSMALGKPYWQGMLQLANAYDPKFDETVWKGRNTTRTAFDVGAEGKNVTKINTAIGHLDSFDKAAQALNNGSLPFVNYVSNTLMPQLGNTELAGKIRTFQQAKEAVANELMSVFRGVGASSGDTAKWAETLNASDSPEALRAAVKSAVELLDSRIGALGEQYKRGMSMSSDVNVLGMVYPKAQSTLDRLRAGKPGGPTDAGKIAGGKPTGGIKFLGFE